MPLPLLAARLPAYVVVLLSGMLLWISSAAAQTLPRQWNRTLGNTGTNVLDRMRPTADGGYLLGAHIDPSPGPEISGAHRGILDYWVVKLGPQGEKQWDRVLGGTEDEYVADIASTTDGGYIVGGWSRSGASGDKTQPSRGYSDYWVVKLDALGRTQWEKTLGGSANDYLTGVSPTPDGGYLVSGNSYSRFPATKQHPPLRRKEWMGTTPGW